MSNLLFQFIKRPVHTGAVLPSSVYLARMLVSGIGLEHASVIVELGPGTGAITKVICEKKNEKSSFLAIELNKEVIPDFQKNFPDEKIIEESAANLPDILQKENLPLADTIVSSLPWASFSAALQEELLTAIVSGMANGASFATFAYIQGVILPRAHIFRKNLGRYFSRVEKTPVIWRNFPPAYCYHCWK